jgi:hypothetical protein
LQERTPQRRNTADIGLGSASPDGEADGRARHVGRAGRCDRAIFDQRIELRTRQDGNIEHGAVLDRPFQGRGQAKFNVDRRGIGPLERRDRLRHQRPHGAAAEDFKNRCRRHECPQNRAHL